MENVKIKNLNSKMNKKAISTIIAGIVLVAVVVSISAFIFVFIRGFLNEVKNNEGNFEILCGEIKLNVEFISTSNILQITNEGDMEIKDIQIKFDKGGESYSKSLNEIDSSFTGLKTQQSSSYSIDSEIIKTPSIKKIELFPVIEVSTDHTKKLHTCDQDGILVQIA